MNDFGNHLFSLSIGRPRCHKNLAVWPLMHRRRTPANAGNLAGALTDGTCTASLLRAPGHLPAWLIRNRSSRALFAGSGEVLSTPAQSVTLIHSVVVGAGACLELPATWLRPVAGSSADAGHELPAWTSGQVGAVFCVDGIVRAIECFGDPDLARRAGVASLNRFAAEAANSRNLSTQVPADRVLARWLRQVVGVPLESVPTLGEGRSFRPVSGNHVGQLLTYNGSLLHARFSEALRVRSTVVRGFLPPRANPRSVEQVTLADPWAG